MTQRAVILAAGRGSRLGLNQELPKPLQPVGGVASDRPHHTQTPNGRSDARGRGRRIPGRAPEQGPA
jgi:hypothetical protein